MKNVFIYGTLGAWSVAALLTGPLQAGEMPSAGSMGATMICRTAGSDDHANAQMMGQSRQLVCKPLAMAMKMSDGSMRVIGTVTSRRPDGPDLTRALTPQQVNDAWIGYLQREFSIDHSP